MQAVIQQRSETHSLLKNAANERIHMQCECACIESFIGGIFSVYLKFRPHLQFNIMIITI